MNIRMLATAFAMLSMGSTAALAGACDIPGVGALEHIFAPGAHQECIDKKIEKGGQERQDKYWQEQQAARAGKSSLEVTWQRMPRIVEKITDSDAKLAERPYNDVQAGPVGTTRTWSNPDTRHSGKVTRLTEDQNFAKNGATCFQFEHSIVLDGVTTSDKEWACSPMKNTAKAQ